MWARAGLLSVIAVALLWLWPTSTSPDLDRALPAQAPKSPLRITTFGTSLTAEPQIWPDLLAKTLNRCHPEAQVQVTRVAGPGMGSDWALKQLDRVVQSQPDLILMEFAINDADAHDGVSLSSSRAQHHAVIQYLQAQIPEATILLMTMSPAQGLRGWIRPRLGRYYALYAELADEFGLGLVDHHARWQARPPQTRGLGNDGLHPDPAVAANVILSGLMQALEPVFPDQSPCLRRSDRPS